MSAVCVTATLHVLPGHEEAVIRALKKIAFASRSEQGCLQYDPHQCLVDPRTFMVLEKWASKADLDAHAGRPHMAEFLEAVSDCLTEPSEVLLWEALA